MHKTQRIRLPFLRRLAIPTTDDFSRTPIFVVVGSPPPDAGTPRSDLIGSVLMDPVMCIGVFIMFRSRLQTQGLQAPGEASDYVHYRACYTPTFCRLQNRTAALAPLIEPVAKSCANKSVKESQAVGVFIFVMPKQGIRLMRGHSSQVRAFIKQVENLCSLCCWEQITQWNNYRPTVGLGLMND